MFLGGRIFRLFTVVVQKFEHWFYNAVRTYPKGMAPLGAVWSVSTLFAQVCLSIKVHNKVLQLSKFVEHFWKREISKTSSCVQLAPVAQLDVHWPGLWTVVGSILGSCNIPFVEIGHEVISTAILSLPLIQVGQLSVTCTFSTGKPLRKSAQEQCG